ncbi:MAG: flagellar hook-associated protein FlgL [Kurthia sp.]|nr:flagellar hook-associated protein FlgL [Candidatus Kurthia equi]
MRVTQSMLSNNMLNNLSNSYNKMGKLQDQLASGSKLTRPSDDPVATVKGMNYRTTLAKNEQFSSNLDEAAGWLDATDSALSQVNNGLSRVKDLLIQAGTDSVTDDDRKAIQKEIDQIRMQMRDVANTQQGEKYLFSGTATTTPLFADSTANASAGQIATLGGNTEQVKIEVYDGIQLPVNVNGKDLFTGIDAFISNVQVALDGGKTATDISSLLTDATVQIDKTLQLQASVGAKENRVDTMADRLSSQKLVVTKQMSNNEDVEYEKTITQMITEESTHQAALSVGAKIIQATLVDFIR